MVTLLIAMKFLIRGLDIFFGGGAILVLLDLIIFSGGIEELSGLPDPLKYIIGVIMAIYLAARTLYYIVSKILEVYERISNIVRKRKDFLDIE